MYAYPFFLCIHILLGTHMTFIYEDALGGLFQGSFLMGLLKLNDLFLNLIFLQIPTFLIFHTNPSSCSLPSSESPIFPLPHSPATPQKG